MYPDAERWYRRAMEKDPDRYRPLAVALASQGKYEEAIRLCEDAAARDSSYVPALAAVAVMLSGHPTEKDYERADAILGKAAEKFPDQLELLSNLAGLRVNQPQRMDEATALMRRVLELQPRNVQALNNLATILIERQDTLPEGKKLIEQAIAIAGPQAGLLDLKGVCLITEGKPQEAIPIFEEACAAPRTDPRYCFHWAVACQRAGDKVKANEVLKRARELNLDRQILTPGDKKMLVELDKALSE
jgi:tetratricopeptide (TPR) repeat protein